MSPIADPRTPCPAAAARDARCEGQAVVGMVTTGIFCRIGCPARGPRPETCRWFATADAACAAGFRPCLRCDLETQGAARARRSGDGTHSLAKVAPVITAQPDAGIDSESGFRKAFPRLFGHAPHPMRQGGVALADWIETPLGPMIAIADDDRLHLLEFTDRKALPRGLARLSRILDGRIGLGRTVVTARCETAVDDYLGARIGALDLPVALHGTDFQRRVWTALMEIPPGATQSYRALAARIGSPKAVRAVASANAANRLALVVPCHRVIGADGRPQGYAGGIWRKQRLIALEAAWAANFSNKT